MVGKEKTPASFIIQTNNDEVSIVGRRAAIEKAKKMSLRTWDQVHLERHDKRVSMQFRRGDLLTYRYESPGRRR